MISSMFVSRRAGLAGTLGGVLVIVASAAAGCGDVGDTTSLGPGSVGDAGSGDATALDGSEVDGAVQGAGEQETGVEDTGVGDVGPRVSHTGGSSSSGGSSGGSGASGSSSGESSSGGSGSSGSSSGESSSGGSGSSSSGSGGGADAGPDSTVGDGGGVEDTGLRDSMADAPADSGMDSTVADTGAPDAAEDATADAHADAPEDAPADGRAAEAGTDAASEASGGALAPCTASGQSNCVSCPGIVANNGVCTATEAVFVQLDIASGAVTAAGPDDAAAGCYQCIFAGDCLDTSRIPDQECGDLTGNFTNGSGASVNAASACVATLECVTGPSGGSCGNNADGLSYCYCGAGGGSATNCASHGTAADGPCLAQEAAGFMFAPTDSSDIILNFDDSLEPSGQANSILGCAQSNGCTACFP